VTVRLTIRIAGSSSPPPQAAVDPPLLVPVTHFDSSLARNNAAFCDILRLAGAPNRLGYGQSPLAAFAGRPPIGVLMPPGKMQLTRIRSLPHSTAAQWVRLITLALAAP
jgi:hypothetical protein